MENYLVVLFKNKTKKKIINKFKTFDRAKKLFDNLLKENQNIIFEKFIENGHECNFELAIIERSNMNLVPVYLTDEMGRNIKVRLSNSGMTIFQISKYKKEELIFDISSSKKISVSEILKKYLSGEGLKMISTLNNKIVIQNDEKFYLFSTKSDSESKRFLESLNLHFQKIGRKDCLFIKDVSIAQKKYLYKLLEEYGLDKKKLYRRFTTFPRSS